MSIIKNTLTKKGTHRTLSKNKLNKFNAVDVIITVFLCVLGVIIVYPFYNSFIVSIATQTESMQRPFMLWPSNVTFSAYQFVFKSPSIVSGFRVTAIILFVGTFYNMLLTTSMAYAMTKPFPGCKIVRLLVLFTMFFSGGLIPTYLLIRNLGLLDSLFSMILPSGITVTYLIVMSRFFKAIPIELEESATIDGCSDIGIFWRIILPLSKPVIATYTLYYGVERWNEWYGGMLYIKSASKLPLQMILRNIIQNATAKMDEVSDIFMTAFPDGIKMATVVVIMVPIMCAYPFLQRYFISGLTDGAVKG